MSGSSAASIRARLAAWSASLRSSEAYSGPVSRISATSAVPAFRRRHGEPYQIGLKRRSPDSVGADDTPWLFLRALLGPGPRSTCGVPLPVSEDDREQASESKEWCVP